MGAHRQIEADITIAHAVQCDPGRLGQLTSNLLGNALTHGAEDKPVQLKASIREGILEISVSNSGKQIPPEVLERLFQPFFRGEVRRSRQGLGLGLYICSEIAKAHGGTLTVSSSELATIFTFQMPLKQPLPGKDSEDTCWMVSVVADDARRPGRE